MTISTNTHETRFLAGFLLFLFGLLGLFSGWIPVLTRSSILISKFPVTVAMLCGYCSLVVILSSTIDRFDKDASVGAYRLIGRWFMWCGVFLAAFSISLVVTRTLYADDLLKSVKLFAVGAVTSVLFSLFAYLLLRKQRQIVPTNRRKGIARKDWIKVGLAIILCLVAIQMLYQRYVENQAREASYAAEDEETRRSAKPWIIELEALHGGMTVKEISALARKDGHNIKCYSDLRSEERFRPDDKSACWATVGNVWGIPALNSGFAFSDDGLRNNVLHFPESSWNQIQQKLDQIGQRLPQTFGTEPESGGSVFGWRLNSGLVFSAAPPKGKEVTVLWTAKIDVARDHCLYQGTAARRDPHGYSVPIKQLWPEIDCSKLH